MKRVHPLPTALTLGNFGCGFLAIVLAARSLIQKVGSDNGLINAQITGTDALYLAAACIFLAMLFDMLDGKVARMTGSACQFGAEMDSLADIVSFGIAPAVILTASWMTVEPETARWWNMTMGFGFVYAACACLRLARYNVETTLTAKDYFAGLPSPAAAGAVVSTFLLLNHELQAWVLALLGGDESPLAQQILVKAQAVYMLMIGLLMVSRIRYPHTTNRMLAGRKRFTDVVLAMCCLAGFIMWPVWFLSIGFNGYVAAGLLGELSARLKRRPYGGTPAASDTEAQVAGQPQVGQQPQVEGNAQVGKDAQA